MLHIVVPNAYSLHRRLALAMGIISKVTDFSERDIVLGHRRVYIKNLLLSHLRKAGLRSISFEGILLKPLPNAQMDKWDQKIICAVRGGKRVA